MKGESKVMRSVLSAYKKLHYIAEGSNMADDPPDDRFRD